MGEQQKKMANFINQILHPNIPITQVMYLVRSSAMFAAQFVAISNIIHHHLAVMMRLKGMTSLWEYVLFCMEFVGNVLFL